MSWHWRAASADCPSRTRLTGGSKSDATVKAVARRWAALSVVKRLSQQRHLDGIIGPAVQNVMLGPITQLPDNP